MTRVQRNRRRCFVCAQGLNSGRDTTCCGNSGLVVVATPRHIAESKKGVPFRIKRYPRDLQCAYKRGNGASLCNGTRRLWVNR